MRTLIKALIIIAVFAFLLFGGTCSGAARYQIGRDSAVLLSFSNGAHCSGTAVGKNLILTARHCFGDDVTGMAVDGREARWKIMADDGQDHVLVWVGLKLDRRIARLCRAPLDPGEEVYVWGNPLDFRYVLRIGRIAGYVTLGGEELIAYDANLWHGDSGAALFSARLGCIAGVVYGAHGEAPMRWRLGIAKPIRFEGAIMRRLQ